MKQKTNLKAKREEQKNGRADKYREQAAEKAAAAREEEQKHLREENERKKRAARAKLAAQTGLSTNKMKSSAKAAGLKSTFETGDGTLLMTSFGRGNDAVIEKEIARDNTVTDKNNPGMFTVEANPEKKQFDLQGRVRMQAVVNDPRRDGNQVRDDLIHNKSKLEQRFFGKTFDDNIHIQLIYNILDIDKILSIHINNIIYAINNLRRVPEENHDEFLGYIFGISESFDEFQSPEMHYKSGKLKQRQELLEIVNKLIESSRMGYFGSLIYDGSLFKDRKQGKPGAEERIEQHRERTYYLIALLAMVRQSMAHNNADIYKLEPEFDGNTPAVTRVEARKALDEIYSGRIGQLNKDFLTNSAKNLLFLFDILDAKTDGKKQEIAQDYYDFCVRKVYKNLGFSIKTLRETILEFDDARLLKNQKFDTMRSKLYGLFDFIVYEQYKNNPKTVDDLVAELRAADNEADKQLCYIDESKRLWEKIRHLIMDKLLIKMNAKEIRNTQGTAISQDALNGIMLTEDAAYFSKLIYLLTNFLDGKEINDLLTTLINKFENIESFLSVLKGCGIDYAFANDYRLLERSGDIASELRVINSFARMTKPKTERERLLCLYAAYFDAANVLGCGKSGDELKADINAILHTEKSDGTLETNFRNFLVNNVIGSRRFLYLMRYANAENARALANNRVVIEFVLKDIPDTQIDHYVASVTGGTAIDTADKRAYLAGRITELKFDDFRNVNQSESARPGESTDKERKKALVGLYLTVLYLLTKNLVYVNSRYFLAFHCAERDAQIADKNKYPQDNKNTDLRAFARDFIEEHPGKKRVYTYLKQNFANSDEWAVRTFRNKAAHLDAVLNAYKYLADIRSCNSYYEMYHYIMQCTIRDQYAYDSSKREVIIGDQTKYYFSFIGKYHNYNKDFVKALNVAFAYNLPRFKSLSIEGQFDRNRPGKEDSEEKTEE